MPSDELRTDTARDWARLADRIIQADHNAPLVNGVLLERMGELLTTRLGERPLSGAELKQIASELIAASLESAPESAER